MTTRGMSTHGSIRNYSVSANGEGLVRLADRAEGDVARKWPRRNRNASNRRASLQDVVLDEGVAA